MNFLNKKTRLIRYIRHATEIVLLKLIAVPFKNSANMHQLLSVNKVCQKLEQTIVSVKNIHFFNLQRKERN